MSLASLVAGFVYPGLTIHLSGDLGAGKTVFVRGLSNALEVNDVKSPSFTLVNEYHGSVDIAHVDLYRLECGDEIELDLESYVYDGYLLIIEWAEKLEDPPSEDIWKIHISYKDGAEQSLLMIAESSRHITFTAQGEKASRNLEECLNLLKKEITLP